MMKSDSLPKLMHLDGRSESSGSDKANSFFESVYSNLPSDTLHDHDHDSPQQQATLDFINITDLDVLTALTNLEGMYSVIVSYNYIIHFCSKYIASYCMREKRELIQGSSKSEWY